MVLQRWGFIGMFDSAAERIGYLARWDPDFAPRGATMRVARQARRRRRGAQSSRRGSTSTKRCTTSRS
jgi:hypothetical protein